MSKTDTPHCLINWRHSSICMDLYCHKCRTEVHLDLETGDILGRVIQCVFCYTSYKLSPRIELLEVVGNTADPRITPLVTCPTSVIKDEDSESTTIVQGQTVFGYDFERSRYAHLAVDNILCGRMGWKNTRADIRVFCKCNKPSTTNAMHHYHIQCSHCGTIYECDHTISIEELKSE
jgi:hypothetical protein